MSDFEDADFCLEYWDLLPKRKKKKESKKDRKKTKPKNSKSLKTQESFQKKGKDSECMKEEMKVKDKKKEKKKKNKNKEKGKMRKKDKLASGRDHFTFTQNSSTLATLLENIAIPSKLTQDSTKEAKRKKMVAFGSLPPYICAKRPKFVSTPKEADDVKENESCSQVSLTGQAQSEAHDNVQCTSDDVNSQDLFITQKTFRASPFEMSSSEASDVIAASPQMFKQRNKSQQHAAVEEIKPSQEKPDRCPQDEGVHELHQRKKISLQTQKKFKPILAQQKRPKVVNPYLDGPFVINPTPDAALSHHSTSGRPHHESYPLPPCTTNSSTQTENFFTTELSSYLSFCKESRAAGHLEDLKPLDLSLPQRVRKDLCLSVKMSIVNGTHDPGNVLLQGERGSDTGDGVFAFPQVEHAEVKKDLSCCETTPSPQSEEADAKSADAATSSEDDHPGRSGKKDPMHVRAVQWRLNKPFFFKTKGEGQSPRPESPLTKLFQGRDIKIRKYH